MIIARDLIAWLLVFLVQGEPPDPLVADLENAVLKQRKAIQRGMVLMEAKRFGDGEKTPRHEGSARIWFDYPNNKVRSDRTYRSIGERPTRSIQCMNCEREGHYFNYDDQQGEGAKGSRAFVLLPIDGSTKGRLLTIFDPRLLGLVPAPAGLLCHYHFETILGRPDREKPTLRQDTWKGSPCSVIEYVDFKRNRVEVWIVPDQGYNVVHISFEGRYDGEVWRETLDTEAEPFKNTGIWYPRTCIYEQRVDGKLKTKEVLTVTEVALNEPLDDSVFTLAAMDIPKGTPVIGPVQGREVQHTIWDGEQLVKNDGLILASSADSQHRSGLFWVSIGCAVLACAGLGMYVYRRVQSGTAAPRGHVQ